MLKYLQILINTSIALYSYEFLKLPWYTMYDNDFFAKELKLVTNQLEYIGYSTYFGIVLLLYVNKFYRRQIILTWPNRIIVFTRALW